MARRQRVYPVILSGGAGTRLWPLSRVQYPKQLLPLTSDRTLLQETAIRVKSKDLFHPPTVVTNEEHRFVVAEQLREIDITPKSIVLEPLQRNTAPAAAVASLILSEEDPDAVIILMPSDHKIQDQNAFEAKVERALEVVPLDWIVTFGIRPIKAETGYGYIRGGLPLKGIDDCFKVAEFVEKPDLITAEHFLKQSTYTWNSGIFVFRTETFLAELKFWQVEMFHACERSVLNLHKDLDFLRLDSNAFAKINAESIDRAVMEKTNKAVVIPADMGWSDVGGWDSLWNLEAHDEDGNVKLGDVVLDGVSGSYLRSKDGKLLAVSGVEDFIIVVTDDATLVTPRIQSGDRIKRLVAALSKSRRDEVSQHRRLYRPWGYSQEVDIGYRFKVKRLVVKSGGSLSLQRHFKRAEHWVVVKGIATVVRGKETVRLGEGESTYIKLGEIHRLKNDEGYPLHIIEVQTGNYLGEDDIERLEDDYGRKGRG